MVTPAARRDAARHLAEGFGASVRRGCGLPGIRRSSHCCKGLASADGPLRAAILAVAEERRRRGGPRVVARLRREGWTDNRKRIERIRREEGLQARRRNRKRIGLGAGFVLLAEIPALERTGADPRVEIDLSFDFLQEHLEAARYVAGVVLDHG